LNADLIISHHPLIFSPVKRIVEGDVLGGILRTLIKNNISVYSAHTNLDNADGGMNDVLSDKLGLEDVRRFTDEECRDSFGAPIDNIGRIGYLESPIELEDFKALVKSILGCRTIRSLGNPTDMVSNVALCTGSGGEGIYSAYHAGADVYVTSDIKHHEAQLAFELGINLIDAGHFETENTICEFLKEYLEQIFPDIKIVPSDAEPYLL
ncbi:MAG: Nif3-like dinuclear metal center hexameric protein, partial [Clostridia bacterium]|nr:Nif3-like dinuclear metal center hexameric protein [Clostridia bacterium]